MRVDGNGNMIGRRNRYSLGGGNGATFTQGILSPRGSMPTSPGSYGTEEYDETKSVRSAGRSLSIQINNINSVKKQLAGNIKAISSIKDRMRRVTESAEQTQTKRENVATITKAGAKEKNLLEEFIVSPSRLKNL